MSLLVSMVFLPFLLGYFVYWTITRARDRLTERRYKGKLLDDATVSLAFATRAFSSRPLARSTEASAEREEPDHVFQYVDYACTGFVPVVEQMPEDEEFDAYRLARDDRPTALRMVDSHTWNQYRLSDPQVRERYRTQVQLGRVLAKGRRCLYCDSQLIRKQTHPIRMSQRFLSWNYIASLCPGCGWWYVTHFLEKDAWVIWGEYYSHAYAVMQRYDPLALDTPLRLARGYLARNTHKLARVDPFRFEDLMADCLADVHGDAEIIKVGGRKDWGIDIKAVRAGGRTTLIQVKRHGDFSRSESVQTVRELHGVMLREGTAHGMVITTARDFSPAVYEEVARTREARVFSRYSMELLPLADVVELLSPPVESTETPWDRCGIRLDVDEPDWDLGNDWIDRSALPSGLADVY